ncbi:MAG: hypothetical protein FD170_2083 [Bacteroidetes bacterium]|nr:MAG: hypothetical protein FD170_2083 [Bacteroidota bacterium]
MFQKRRLSVYVVLLLAVSLVVFRSISLPTRALSWDVFGYYLYLPATFIYDDPGLENPEWVDEVMEKYQPSATLYQLVNGTDGKKVIKYTSGLALLYSPFFLIAHWIAPALGYPADGFSLPYQLILSLGGILWAIFGLIILRKLLLRLFDDRTTAVTILLIGFGTNYFQLTAFDGTLLSQNFLFSLYAFLLYTTIRWYERPSLKRAFQMGLTCGLITLIRPSEIVCLLIPLFWNAGSWRQFIFRFKVMKTNINHVLSFLVPAIIVGSIQFIYWKTTTGNWIFYSYDNPGEGFRFFPPYIFEFLFSYRKGWFVYTPVMLFALAGFYHLYKRSKAWNFAILAYVLLDLWIVSSWSCWWYAGGSFSARAMLPTYVLLALPLASLVEVVFLHRLRWLAAFFGLALIVLNLFQTWQFETGIIDKERMTKDYYWAVFGKTNIDKDKLDELLLVERSTESRDTFKHKDRYEKRSLFGPSPVSSDTTGALKLNGLNPYAPGPEIAYSDLTSFDHAWIYASVEVFIPESYQGQLPRLVAAFHHKGEAYKYRSETISPDSLKPGDWNTISFYYLTPEVRTPHDNLKVYVWQREPSTIYIRNFNVEVWETKK